MKKIFKNKRILIGLIVLLVIFISLKVTNFNPFLDKSNGYFKQTASMNYGRYGHTATLLKNGDVFIFGGNQYTNNAEIYKAKMNKFIKINTPNILFTHKTSAFLLSNGKVLILGCEFINHKFQDSIKFFDPAKNLFYEEKKLKSLMPYARSINIIFFKTQTKLGNNDKIYIINGKKNLSYDLSSNSLISLPSCIIQRVNSTVIPINNQKILILGGRSSYEKNSKYISKTEIYNPVTNKFSLGPIFPELNGSIKFVTLKNNNVLILNNNKAIIYDSKKNQFHSVGNLIKQRNKFECILLKNGKILIVGGVDGYKDSSKGILETEIFDPESESFSIGPKLLYPRKDHQLTLLNNGDVLVTGGEEELNPFNLYDLLLNTDIKRQKKTEIYIPTQK